MGDKFNTTVDTSVSKFAHLRKLSVGKAGQVVGNHTENTKQLQLSISLLTKLLVTQGMRCSCDGTNTKARNVVFSAQIVTASSKGGSMGGGGVHDVFHRWSDLRGRPALSWVFVQRIISLLVCLAVSSFVAPNCRMRYTHNRFCISYTPQRWVLCTLRSPSISLCRRICQTIVSPTHTHTRAFCLRT